MMIMRSQSARRESLATDSRRRIWRGAAIVLAVAGLAACATMPPPVSEGEIPTLEQELTERPGQPELRLRYAAALFTRGDCGAASMEARRAVADAPADAPADPLGPLILGQCYEREGRFEEALSVYQAYLSGGAEVRGADAIRGRQLLAGRAHAEQLVRQSLESEATLGDPDPDVTAVLPVFAGNDPSLAAIATGISTMIQTDLSLLERLRLVERARMQALLDELALAETDRVDPATAPRLGRLVAAGQLVQGVLAGEPDADAALNATILRTGRAVLDTDPHSGRFQDLMELQKQLVLDIARQLGYQLSEAERALILENSTESLSAFLAFADGMLAQDRGIYPGAVAAFSDALRSDPGWGEARQRLRTAVAVEIAVNAQPGDITRIAEQTEEEADEAELESTSADGAVVNSIADIASLQAEIATRDAGGDDADKQIHQLPRVFPKAGSNGTFAGVLRILLTLPRGE